MEAQSWLAPTELDHARVVDAHGRMRTARAVAGGAIGVALLICQPWLPWWTLGLFLIAAVPLLTFERRLKGSAHPERVAAQTLMLILAVLAVGAAGTGGAPPPPPPRAGVPPAPAPTPLPR